MKVAKYLLLSGIIHFNSFAIVPNLDTVDTPTLITIPKGSYSLTVGGYNNGGISAKTIVGLTDYFYLGAAFDVMNLIGSDKIKFNIPGILAKIRFTEGWNQFPLFVGIGYDSFYSFSSRTQEIVYGPYFALTKPLFLFGSEQHIHFGIRMQVQPYYNPKSFSAFISIDIPIGRFVPMIELSNLYFNNRIKEAFINLGLKISLFESLAMELDLFYSLNSQLLSRVFLFEFINFF